MNEFFEFDDETPLTSGIAAKKKTAGDTEGKCEFIDSLILEGWMKDEILEKTLKKFSGADKHKTERTIQSRFSIHKDVDIPPRKMPSGQKLDTSRPRWMSQSFCCLYNPDTDDYDYYAV